MRSQHARHSMAGRMVVSSALLAVAAVAATPAPAHAAVGLGLFVGEPLGLDLKIDLARRSALDVVLGWDTIDTGRAHYGHVTYLATLFVGRGRSVLVPLRLGIGGAIYDGAGGFGDEVNLAVRAPFEVGFLFRRAPVEIYGEIALKATFLDGNNNDPDFDADGGVGFRVYF